MWKYFLLLLFYLVDLFIVKNNKVGIRNFKIFVCECATTRMVIITPFTLQGNNITIIDIQH